MIKILNNQGRYRNFFSLIKGIYKNFTANVKHSGQSLKAFPKIRNKTRMCTLKTSFFFFLSLSLFILRETDMVRAREGQRERGRERIPSRLCAARAEPNMGLKSTKP